MKQDGPRGARGSGLLTSEYSVAEQKRCDRAARGPETAENGGESA